MQKNKLFLVSVAVLLVGAFIFAAKFTTNQKEKDPTAPSAWVLEALHRSDSYSYGDVAAPVTVTEFFDPECEACRAFHASVNKLMGEYEGKVRWIYRYMPYHANSMYAASVLEEARAHGKFPEALSVLFDAQPEWADHAKPRPELIAPLVAKLGIPIELLAKETVISKHQAKILRDQTDGQRVMVTGTPTFYINGRPLFNLGYEPLKAAIERALMER